MSRYSLVIPSLSGTCDEKVRLNVSSELLRAMQALFNDSIGVMKPGGVNTNVVLHVTNIEHLNDKFAIHYDDDGDESE